MTDPTGDALKASAAQVPALTKTQIETLSNNIHNVNDYAYTIECLTYHLGAAALSPVEQAPQPVETEAHVLVPEALTDLTFAIQHNPNCPGPWLVRLPGKSGRIDFKPYRDQLGIVPHQTGDFLGFGKTLDEAASAAIKYAEDKS